MKITATEKNHSIDIELDEDFLEHPWASLGFIQDLVAKLQSMALSIEADAGDPADEASR